MRRRWWFALLIVVLTSLPILLLSPFPTQDGPSHLYGGHLLSHLGNLDYPAINRSFEYSPSALSTWTVHGIASVLLRLLPAPWVEKVIVLIFVGLLFSAFMLGADEADALFFPVCALPLFVMSFVLRMGFYSFCLSMPLAVHAVSVWTGGSRDVSRNHLILAGCLLVLLPFFHLLTAGWALALMGGCSIGSMVIGRTTGRREVAALVLSSLPFLIVAMGYPDSSAPYVWERIGARIAALVAGGGFVGTRPHALWWSALPSGGLLALGLLFFRDEVQAAMHANREALRRVLAMAAALALALLVPEEGAGGAYVGVRCNLLFFLLLLCLLRKWRLSAPVDAVLSLAFLAFSVVHVSETYATLKPASAAERAIVQSASVLRDHTTALVVVAGEWMNTATPTLATQIRPLLHAGDLLGIGADRTILSFYEGALPYFPINFKKEGTPFGVLFDDSLFGWEAPHVRWDAVPSWHGGVDYVAVWDERHLLVSPSYGEHFRNTICAHYEELYRSASWPWTIYHLHREKDGAHPLPRICTSKDEG